MARQGFVVGLDLPEGRAAREEDRRALDSRSSSDDIELASVCYSYSDKTKSATDSEYSVEESSLDSSGEEKELQTHDSSLNPNIPHRSKVVPAAVSKWRRPFIELRDKVEGKSVRCPPRGYFDVRDESKPERLFGYLDILVNVGSLILFVLSFYISNYVVAYSSLCTVSYVVRLFYKWYRVQGGFDPFNALLDDFEPGAIGLLVALWGTSTTVLQIINFFSVSFQWTNILISLFQSCIKIPIRGDVKKFLRAKNLRDRYEEIGMSGLLPCNEATNKMASSTVVGKRYYTLEKIEGTTHSGAAERKRHWMIGKMMVSYSNNGDWVTIKQKAEDRAVKIFMEAFSEEQKRNFVLMMDAWEERPDQGIVKTIRRRTAHCFTLARLVDLTSKGYSVCWVPTDLPRMRVGADVDTGVQDFVDSVKEVLAMVCSHSTQRVSIVVAVIAIFVAFNLYTT